MNYPTASGQGVPWKIFSPQNGEVFKPPGNKVAANERHLVMGTLLIFNYEVCTCYTSSYALFNIFRL
jgi:hypothetical protein